MVDIARVPTAELQAELIRRGDELPVKISEPLKVQMVLPEIKTEPGEIHEYSLNSARNYELLSDILPSDFILAAVPGGTLEGISVRLGLTKSAGANPHMTWHFTDTNPIKRRFAFVFLKNDAQQDKTLRLTIGREASAEAVREVTTDVSKLIPIAKAAIFNTALPAAEANWLTAYIVPTNSPSFLRVYISIAVVGILRVVRKVGAVTVTENLNEGTNLVANCAYMFDIEWRSGHSINFRYSGTGANILFFAVDEIGGAL